jgi:uncharacterized protein YcbK (DUF882 family)
VSIVAPLVLALVSSMTADSQMLARTQPIFAYVDAASSLAGPLAEAIAYIPPGKPGGTDVELYNVNTHEAMSLYLRFDGALDEPTAKELSRFLRCRRTGKKRIMDAGVLGLFAQVAAHYPGHTIEIVSAVRARGFGVKDSKHYTGHAIDFRVRGVSTKQVRDLAWSFDGEIGVGHYKRENFIHLDHRPGEHKVAWEQSRPGTDNHYNPRWAKLARKRDEARF